MVVFTEVTVIDMTGTEPTPGSTVVVTGNTVSAIGSTGSVEIPEGARVVHGDGGYLIPGLWDMHVHPSRDRNVEFLPLMLANGVTGARDMSGDFAEILRWRSARAAGRIVAPRLVGSGQRIDGPGSPDEHAIEVGTEEEARAAVRAQKARGVDFLKLYTRLAPNVFYALADEAAKQGLDICGQVTYYMTPSAASDAGVRSFEQLGAPMVGCSAIESELLGNVIDSIAQGGYAFFVAEIVAQVDAGKTFDDVKAEELFQTLARNGTYQTPALVGWKRLVEFDDEKPPANDYLRYLSKAVTDAGAATFGGFLGLLPAEFLETRKTLFASQLLLVGRMHAAGVPILAGTGAMTPFLVPGFCLHEELGLLVDAGLTPAEALTAATRTPAEYLGMADELGTIEEGKLADLVLLESNPLDDIGNVASIRAVMADGDLLDRTALDELLADVAKKCGDSARSLR